MRGYHVVIWSRMRSANHLDGLKSPIAGQTSKPITGETTYTISCLDQVRHNAHQDRHRPHHPHLPRNLIGTLGFSNSNSPLS